MRRTSFLLFSVLRLAFVPALSAQAVQELAIGRGTANEERQEQRHGPGSGLAPAYTLNLVSDWPQLSVGATCFNGGQEVLDGTLTRTGSGSYAGRLERRATILFCGVHGGAASACALTLTSSGPVEAKGELLADGADGAAPVVELTWSAAAGASEVAIHGDCPARFNDSLRRMYLGVSHTLEFPLPLAGEGARTVHLEDYGWIVEAR
jgi:hypothetical protein